MPAFLKQHFPSTLDVGSTVSLAKHNFTIHGIKNLALEKKSVLYFIGYVPSHIPRLGNSFFWRKQSKQQVGNAKLTTRGALKTKLATHPTGCPHRPL